MADSSTVGGQEALGAMRSARRRRFLGGLNAMEFLYRVYVAAIFGGIGLAFLAGAIGEAPLDAAALRDVADHGPAVLGVAVAVAVWAGLRVGSRGGPLAIEEAEVHYVLLGPVDRGRALRPTAMRQLQIGALAGGALGLAVAAFAIPRLPGGAVEWLIALGSFGALLPLCYLGAALLASGRRLRPGVANVTGPALLAWAGADLLLGVKTCPATMLGDLASLPLQSGVTAALSALGVLAVAALVAIGLDSLGGLSLEAARRRASLSAELRFSASVQDLRAVVLLRRQLAAEHPRSRPWVDLGTVGRSRVPIWRRGWRSFMRWPAVRVLRVGLLGILAGAAVAGAWSGTTVLVALVAALLVVAALDLVEPLAQEVDHPTRRDLLPVSPATLIRRHLAAPVAGMAIVLALGSATAAALGAPAQAMGVGAVMLLPTAVVLVGAAAVSATNDPYRYVLVPAMGYTQSAAPLAVALVAVAAPVLAAREAAHKGQAVVLTAATVEEAMIIVATTLVWFVGWRIAAHAGEET
ncbi:MAG TPA: hypothetical protein VGC49_04025 [Solirubrobacterales bacterium]